MKLEQYYDETILLLHDLVCATETEEFIDGNGVAPWYFEKVVHFYRCLRRTDRKIIRKG